MAGRPGGRRGLFLAAAGGLRSAERLQSSPLDWQTGYGVRRYHLGRAAHLPTHTSVLNCTVGVSVQCLRGRLQGCGGGDRWEPTWGRWDDGACSFPELEAGRNRNRPVSRTTRARAMGRLARAQGRLGIMMLQSKQARTVSGQQNQPAQKLHPGWCNCA